MPHEGPFDPSDKPAANRIHHTAPSFSRDPEPAEPEEDSEVPVASAPRFGSGAKITNLGPDRKHEDNWARTPNTTGRGAIHVKTFHCKLTDDALHYMDQTINEWLDAHPQYEVKFVNASVGILTGKLKEPHLICQVWV